MDLILKQLIDNTDTERLNVVTTKRDILGDNHGGYKPVAVMKYYKMTSENEMYKRPVEDYDGVTYEKYEWELQPRKFYTMASLKAFMEVTERRAGRPIEDAEWGLLLRAITNGKRYKLVCIRDITGDLKDCRSYKELREGV